MTTLLSNFPSKYTDFFFFSPDFWRLQGLESRSQPSAGSWPSWLHLVLLYLSSIFFGSWDVCHGNIPQRAVGGWPTLSGAFPSLAVMKGSLCPWSLTPDEEASQFQLQVLRGPHVPLLLHQPSPVRPNRACLNYSRSFAGPHFGPLISEIIGDWRQILLSS